jgi:hypothetical protein
MMKSVGEARGTAVVEDSLLALFPQSGGLEERKIDIPGDNGWKRS